jgi:hypothetical protein
VIEANSRPSCLNRKWRFVGNTAQPARVDDLVNALDGFLRRADNIIILSDYIHATGRATRGSPDSGGT